MKRPILAFLAVCLFTLQQGLAAQIPKLDRAWKHYTNNRSGFCVSYPSRWYRAEAFEGAGMFVETGTKKFSKPLAEIDVTLLERPGLAPQTVAVSLVESFQIHLDGLRRFEGAQSMKVLEQREGELSGDPALFTKDSFYDPQDRGEWVDEIVFVKHGPAIYRLELQSRADHLARFEPVFSHLVGTFQADCKSGSGAPAN